MSKWLLVAGVAFQLLALGSMIAMRVTLLQTGETVLLRVVPVDPRDMFRSNYVTLSYDFSHVPPQGIAGLEPRKHNYRRRRGQDDWAGKTVYVSLVAEADGEHWRAEQFSLEPPGSGKYIRGTIVGWNRIQFGIEAYYVQEGKRIKYEQAVRDHKLSAEVALSSDGRAALRGLRVDAEPDKNAPRKPAYEYTPSGDAYRVRYLPKADIRIDGRADESAWSRANVERHFVFPWKNADAPPTEFLALCDDEYLYFTFRVEDADIVVLDKLRDKEDGVFEDRVEMFFSRDSQMKDYYCLEIDSRGRAFDYRGSYYRKFDTKWRCEGLETAGVRTEKGYAVEGRIPLATLVEMGFPRLRPGKKILCGLYRAEFSHDRSGKPVEQEETIHNRGRKLDGPPPIEEWISWIDPKTPEPDFHVPSSLGWLEIVK